MKIFKNVLKWLLIVFISIILIFASFVVVGAVSGYNSASADEITPYSNDTVYPDNELLNGGSFSDYPTFNIMPYPYNSEYGTLNGITATAMGDGGVVFNGTADGNYAFYFIYNGQNITFSNANNYYTFNLNIYGASESSYYGVLSRTGAFSIKIFNRGVIPYSDLSNPFNFYFLIKSGTTVSNLYVRPQINIGDVEYPYLPPYDKLMQTAFDSGYDSGKSDGFEQGSVLADYSYFANCEVIVFKNINEYQSQFLNQGFIDPDFISYGIKFDNIYNALISNNVDLSGALSFGVTIMFDKPVPLSLFKPYAYNSVYGDHAFINFNTNTSFEVSVDNKSSSWLPVADNSYLFTPDTSFSNNFSVRHFEFLFSDFDFLKDYVVYDSLGVNNVYFQQGYEQGLKDGVITEEEKQGYINQGIAIGEDMGYKNGYELGYDNGKSDGEDIGYNKGFQQGASDKLTSENFFNRVLSILNVPIFGVVSMGDILKISVSCMLVIFALKLFAGG